MRRLLGFTRIISANAGGMCLAALFALSILLAWRLESRPALEGELLPAAATPLTGAVIVIDPGHGGYDCGAVGRFTGTLEKDLNLELSLALRDILVKGGASVIMTRETDISLCPEGTPFGKLKKEDMAARASVIDEAAPDIVLSIHMNEYTNSKYYGAQVFYLEGGEHPEAESLARIMQDSLRENLDKDNTRKQKSGDYFILRMRPASVLIECGFLSNQREEQLLLSPEYREKVAWAIYAGVVDYLNLSE